MKYDLMKDLGLVWDKHWFTFGMNHGMLMKAPSWVKRFIVHTWNPIACRIWGHSTIGPFKDFDEPKVCTNCSKRWHEQ